MNRKTLKAVALVTLLLGVGVGCTDPSVAPPGKHVLSCFVQYAPYKLAEGTWDDQREAFGDIELHRAEISQFRFVPRNPIVTVDAEPETSRGDIGV